MNWIIMIILSVFIGCLDIFTITRKQNEKKIFDEKGEIINNGLHIII